MSDKDGWLKLRYDRANSEAKLISMVAWGAPSSDIHTPLITKKREQNKLEVANWAMEDCAFMEESKLNTV